MKTFLLLLTLTNGQGIIKAGTFDSVQDCRNEAQIWLLIANTVAEHTLIQRAQCVMADEVEEDKR